MVKNNNDNDNDNDNDNVNDNKNGFGNKPSIEEESNCLSKLTFWWGNTFVYHCYRHILEIKHIWNISSYDSSEFITKKLSNYWEIEKKKQKPSFQNVLFKSFGKYYIKSWFFYIIYIGSQFVGPIILSRMVNFISKHRAGLDTEEIDPYWGYYYGLILFACNLIGSLCQCQSNMICARTGCYLRSSIVLEVYKKSLKLSNSSRTISTSTGQIVNLISNDAQHLLDVATMINSVLFSIPQIIICITLLYREIGWITFIGFGLLLIGIPLNSVSTKSFLEIRKKMSIVTDSRLKLTNEIIQSIKTIKLYAWEDSFIKKLIEKRDKEIKLLFEYTKLISIIISFLSSIPTLSIILVFSTYYGYYKEMNPARIFSSLSYLNLLRSPIGLLPITVSMFVQMRVSIKRITDFLLLSEIKPVLEIDNQSSLNGIYVRNATFSWSDTQHQEQQQEQEQKQEQKQENQKSFMLKNIDININGPTLTIVVGSVGSGKSSLVNALLGEMNLINGDIFSKGSIGYVSQKAWIINATLRDNILFGKPYNQDFYKQVLEACALEKDLELFPQGDLVEIGERGINLSGGQKQRVSIARAVYSNADIYILDDPLSALDVHVCKHLFHKCFKGLLSNKTILLVTNQLNLVSFSSETIVLKDGIISERGSYKSILDSNSEFSKLLKDHSTIKDEGNNDSNCINGASEGAGSVEIKDKTKSLEKVELKNKDGSLTTIEEREEGAVSFKYIWIYMKFGGGFFMIVLSLFVIDIGSKTFVDWWLSHWQTILIERSTNQATPTTNLIDNLSNIQLLGVYIGIGVCSIIISIVRTFIFNYYTVIIARSIHNKLVYTLMNAPMWFFDITPIGRIVSRFSRDQDTIDNLLSAVIAQFIYAFLNTTAIIVLISIFIPYILIPMVPIAATFIIFIFFYRFTSRELQRIESNSRSPIFSHITETLNGVETIRSFKKTNDFILANQKLLDDNNKCYLLLKSMNQWLGLRLDFLCNLVIFFTCIFISVDRSRISISIVGLVLSYSFCFSYSLNTTAFQCVDLETKLNSLERIYQYIKGPVEATKIIEPRPKESWPENGNIIFENVSMSYRVGLDPVLHSICFEIKAKEKIAILGRTGSGKSSILLALLRLVEISQGKIIIDGKDISKIGLLDLRRNICIIPQQAVMFSGTIRDNLDPFNEKSDDKIWRLLEDIQLYSLIKSLEDGIYSKVNENGENFSVGQCQLLCIGRAILKQPKILVLDEATSSIDGATDQLIQRFIRERFINCTVLTIAHRLNTIMDSDRIMALDIGRIVEFDKPSNLLKNHNSVFSYFVKESSENFKT